MTTYCDHCGEPQQEQQMFHYQHLPYAVASANEGESGSVCADCDNNLNKKGNNQ